VVDTEIELGAIAAVDRRLLLVGHFAGREADARSEKVRTAFYCSIYRRDFASYADSAK